MPGCLSLARADSYGASAAGGLMKVLTLLIVLMLPLGEAAAQCCGDCSGDGNVTINDLITAVNNALNGCAAEPCCGDCSGDGEVTINDLITAVNNALHGCSGETPTVGTPAPA